MNVRITKGTDQDYIEAERPDGTTVALRFPKKGAFPQDPIHIVELLHLERIVECFEAELWGNRQRSPYSG